MTNKFNLELKVGLFAFIGFVILILAVFSITEIYIFRPGYNIEVEFGFSNGITVGAPVRVAGLQVGEVKKINLSYDRDESRAKIALEIWLSRNIKIPKDSRAYVNILGLVGDAYLEIIPGKDYLNPLEEGEVLIGVDPLSTQSIMEIVNNVARNFDDLLESVNKAINDETTDDFKKIVKNIREVTDKLGAETAEDLKATIGNFREFTDKLDAEAATSLKETITNFEDFSASIKVITGRLERGEGKLGSYLKTKSKKKKKAKEE